MPGEIEKVKSEFKSFIRKPFRIYNLFDKIEIESYNNGLNADTVGKVKINVSGCCGRLWTSNVSAVSNRAG